MATLRIPLPDAEKPVTVVLRGTRLTMGRALDNTIQIRDRTVSAHHVELIEDGDHYRLHDLGATNGVVVDGQRVTDYHLCQNCKILLGGVQCEFSPETPPPAPKDETLELATRAECEVLMRDKAALVEEVKTLREEIALLQQTNVAPPGAPGVPKPEYDRLVAELAKFKELVNERDRQIERLVSSRAVLQRDRDNLQRAVEDARQLEPAAAPAFSRPQPPAAGPSQPANPLRPNSQAPSVPQLPKPPVPLPTLKPGLSAPTPLKPFPIDGPRGTQRIASA